MLSALLLVACATPDPQSRAQPAAQPAEIPPMPSLEGPMRCYEGDTVVRDAQGNRAPDMHEMLQRDELPKFFQIVENITRTGVSPGAPPTRISLFHEVVDGRTSFVHEQGKLRGTGVLHGPDWAWTGWTSTIVMLDGSRVESEETVTEAGLHWDRKLVDADGSVVMTYVSDLAVADCPDMRKRREALMDAPISRD